ncbi:hypothetical protein [Azospirillum sp. TSO22-1]|uniref:hypothetical protein n=1 Tax=Azospirillum sp. TSO22-1 TaxID=716789 RepID=UPI000D603EA2|nr:hypothetical protein [Azospirillum sp. TSO22-1]PWC44808.1 hypothetical protein TSO221_17385 [Azospirillum sp. TSO22-1]
MKTIKPYANESDSVGIAGLTVENRTDRVSLYGSLDLTRDKDGLQNARALRDLLDRVVTALEADKALPDRIPPPQATDNVDNPFS